MHAKLGLGAKVTRATCALTHSRKCVWHTPSATIKLTQIKQIKQTSVTSSAANNGQGKNHSHSKRQKRWHRADTAQEGVRRSPGEAAAPSLPFVPPTLAALRQSCPLANKSDTQQHKGPHPPSGPPTKPSLAHAHAHKARCLPLPFIHRCSHISEHVKFSSRWLTLKRWVFT